jgi:hypothetical protein
LRSTAAAISAWNAAPSLRPASPMPAIGRSARLTVLPSASSTHRYVGSNWYRDGKEPARSVITAPNGILRNASPVSARTALTDPLYGVPRVIIVRAISRPPSTSR